MSRWSPLTMVIRAPVTLASTLLVLCAVACAGPKGRHLSASEYEQMERADLAEQVASEAAESRATGGARSELQRKADDLDGTLADDRHERDELVLERERVAIEHAGAEAREAHALRSAQLQLAQAREALTRFVEVGRPLRLEEQALSLGASRDGLLETREELAQLELMYSGAELGEGTAEIVLERTRRRLARAEAQLAIAVKRGQELEQVELPRELARLELEVESRSLEVAEAERAHALGQLQRQSALRGLDHREQQIARRLDGHEQDRVALESQLRDLERRRLGSPFAEGQP